MTMAQWTLHRGDCRDSMRTMDAESIDAIVCDPPYGLSFMGRGWDHGVPGVEFWEAALRVAKPGCHLLAFGGTRTFHRLTVAIEDAGWDIRDCLMWVYGSGFPKSHDVSKAIDREAGAEREVVGKSARPSGLHRGKIADYSPSNADDFEPVITAPATDAARQWQGWGTALKPSYEPVILARKPFLGTVAANVLEHGTGALNVDGCRVEDKRWPANLIHDGSDEVVGLMAEAVRFFYCAKASKRDRDEGCEGLEERHVGHYAQDEWSRQNMGNTPDAERKPVRNHHPTVKPTDLMRYLCRLVTPPGGLVLDPFGGSGSTGKAAILEGFRAVLCELTPDYWPIIEARCAAACKAAGVVEQVEPRPSKKPVQRRLFGE